MELRRRRRPTGGPDEGCPPNGGGHSSRHGSANRRRVVGEVEAGVFFLSHATAEGPSRPLYPPFAADATAVPPAERTDATCFSHRFRARAPESSSIIRRSAPREPVPSRGIRENPCLVVPGARDETGTPRSVRLVVVGRPRSVDGGPSPGRGRRSFTPGPDICRWRRRRAGVSCRRQRRRRPA